MKRKAIIRGIVILSIFVFDRKDDCNINKKSFKDVFKYDLVIDDMIYNGAIYECNEAISEGKHSILFKEKNNQYFIKIDNGKPIKLYYKAAIEGFEAYPNDDSESHIFLKKISENGYYGIEFLSCGKYGKYTGKYFSKSK